MSAIAIHALLLLSLAAAAFARDMKYSAKYSGDNVFLKSVDHKFNLNLDSGIRDDIAKLQTNSTSDEPTQSDVDKAVFQWPARIFSCMRSLSALRCFKIFLLGRVNRVLTLMKKTQSNDTVSVDFEVTTELANDFKWEEYKHIKENLLDELIIDGVKDLFKNKTTKLIIFPGVVVDVKENVGGSIVLNVMKDRDVAVPRGNKVQKGFYRILPLLLIPPLIMSAVLPFVLPALKLMIVGVGIINQVAFWGAILTLMRNNAFDDRYEKKVVYVNEGYLNEHRPPSFISKSNYFSRKRNGPHTRLKPKPYRFKNFPPLTTTVYEEETPHVEYEDFAGGNNNNNNYNKHLDFSDIDFDNAEKFSNFYSNDFSIDRTPEYTKRRDTLSGPIIV